MAVGEDDDGKIDYNAFVRPLITSSGQNYSKAFIRFLFDAILQRSDSFLTHGKEFQPFYSNYVAISTHIICTQLVTEKDTNTDLTSVCKVLLECQLGLLKNPIGCTLSQTNIMDLIQSLCTGESRLSKTDVVTFTAGLKQAKVPHWIQTGNTETEKSTKESAKAQEEKRPRLDTGRDIFTHLTSLLDDVSASRDAVTSRNEDLLNAEGDTAISHLLDPSEEAKQRFIARNLNSLHELHGADMLLEICSELAYLKRYLTYHNDMLSGRTVPLPSSVTEAAVIKSSVQCLVNDMGIVSQVFSLPIYEPLTMPRLTRVANITMAGIHAAMATAVANSITPIASQEEGETYLATVVQRALDNLSTLCSAVQGSSRVGGAQLRNIQALAASILTNGLSHTLAMIAVQTVEKTKEKPKTEATSKGKDSKETPSKSSTGTKSSTPGLCTLCVALGMEMTSLLSVLMEDVKAEQMSELQSTLPKSDKMTVIDIHGSYSALDRLSILTRRSNINTLLFALMPVAFKKAMAVSRIHQATPTADATFSEDGDTSDSNTCYDEDFSSCDSSTDEDDDSEPILGDLFNEPTAADFSLSTPPPLPVRSDKTRGATSSGFEGKAARLSRIPDKKDGDAYTTLAAVCLQLISKHILVAKRPEIVSLPSMLPIATTHLTCIATLIRDVDNNSDYADEFSAALARFTHQLIKYGLSSPELKEHLLEELGINPCTRESNWPPYIAPRSLAVLAELILLQQQCERAGEVTVPTGMKSETMISNIWSRFLDTLVDMAGQPNYDAQDVNVEHMQVLVFLFHSLALMQKKSFLLQLASKLSQVLAEYRVAISCHLENENRDGKALRECVPLGFARMVLLLDYMLHYFYDPPVTLIEQVQWNLFGAYTSGTFVLDPLHYSPCKQAGQSTQTLLDRDETRPQFYNLALADYSNQDVPKVDGLACSFLLSNHEILDYNSFYDSCVALSAAGSKCDFSGPNAFKKQQIVHYHLVLLWRLLGALPPSVQYIQVLDNDSLFLSDSAMLHTLRWAPRLAHKTFSAWVTDCLVKQGQTTKAAVSMLESVVKRTEKVGFDVYLTQGYMQTQIDSAESTSSEQILSASALPCLAQVYILDAAVAKVAVSLDDLFTKSMAETHPQKAMQVAQDLLPATLKLIEIYTIYIRSCVLAQYKLPDGSEASQETLQAYGTLLSIGSRHPSETSSLAANIMGLLPNTVSTLITKWDSARNEFPSIGAWRNAYANDAIPVESYIDAILSAHINTLSHVGLGDQFTLSASLRHLLQALLRFCEDLIIWCPDDASPKEMARVLLPLVCDVSTEFCAETVTSCLGRILGPIDGEKFTAMLLNHVLGACYNLIGTHKDTSSVLDERVLHEVLTFMEKQLDSTSGRQALHTFFTNKADLIDLLLSATTENLSQTYSTRVLRFFNKLFQLAEKFPNEASYREMCSSLSGVAHLETSVLQNWLSQMITSPPQQQSDVTSGDDDKMAADSDLAPPPPPPPPIVSISTSTSKTDTTAEDTAGKIQENRLLLQSITSYIVKDGSHVGEEVANAILSALIPMGSQILSPSSEGMGFSELMVVMATLAGAGSGSGHVTLVMAACDWLILCKDYLSQERVLEKLEAGVEIGAHKSMLESTCYLLSYLADILIALKTETSKRAPSPTPIDGDTSTTAVPGPEVDSDWAEELGDGDEDEDSGGEDSEDDSLNNKLCTFSLTQKEFMNQHWYHCHTCKMVDSVGVCTVCAKVCHKDHDLSYTKYGSFFCDCGAKEDGSCQALVKRTPQTSALDSANRDSTSSPFSMEHMLTSRLRRRLTPPTGAEKGNAESGGTGSRHKDATSKAREQLAQQIQSCRDPLQEVAQNSGIAETVLDMLKVLMPGITANYHQISPTGSAARAMKALKDLRELPKTCEHTDQLMTATLGSQEGAFENVRMNYSGDQGQQIRQLITNHVLRRVAMCCLSSPLGKRQHLAVSHEKGKVTILQLSALLKQADTSKRKLTLTRLASAPTPFTVISITGNPCNEDYLAVCGLKECHVVTLSSGGTVTDHLVLHPLLDTGNFIIKAVWLPGSQSELAIVTADFVKIYDLSKDAISPQYFFLLPTGKVRDVTFVCRDEKRFMLLIASSGYIYWQEMNSESSAQHGLFYITNVIEVDHPEVTESSGTVVGGGVSVYYSHMLRVLFFSYTQGKTFAGPLADDMEKLSTVFQISARQSGNGGKASAPQPMVGWCEVVSHPGLVCAMTQSSNNPIILMVKPDVIQVQEVKVQGAKTKIQDMVVIRHSGSSDQRTTLILLCEDGSLKIYMANTENTNYWLSSSLQPHQVISEMRPPKRKKLTKQGTPGGQVSFPADFFEGATNTNDVDFGGNDVLQIYNVAQVKHRLNTNGLYIANTKPNGFSIDITNTGSNTVIVGVRVQVGSQSLESAPSYVEVCGRQIQLNVARPRWFDIPFTRDESLTADKKVSVTFGVSLNPSHVTMIDSIKVYVKTKEQFGWPGEEADEYANEGSSSGTKLASSPSPSAGYYGSEATLAPMPLTSIDRLLASSLEVIDGCIGSTTTSTSTQTTIESDDCQSQLRARAKSLASELLTLPVNATVEKHSTALLMSLFNNKTAYHSHKDGVQLEEVINSFDESAKQDKDDNTTLDPESYQRMLLTARTIATSRPSNLVRIATPEDDSMDTAEKTGDATETLVVQDLEDESAMKEGTSVDSPISTQTHFLVQAVDLFWKLHAARPKNPLLAPACLPGLSHIDSTVHALVDVIHAFTTCDTQHVPTASALYIQLLLSMDTQISFSARAAIVRALRPKQKQKKRVFIPSPPRCSTPGGGGANAKSDPSGSGSNTGNDDDDGSGGSGGAERIRVASTNQQSTGSGRGGPGSSSATPGNGGASTASVVVARQPLGVSVEEHSDDFYELLPDEAMHLDLAEDASPNGGVPSNLAALLGPDGNLSDLGLLRGMAGDDETMVELAIALSLQEQGEDDEQGGAQGLSLQGLRLPSASQGSSLEVAQLSDTTASAAGSDDDGGSTAATDGSTLRTSPAPTDQPGSGAGSESGGSQGDSVSVSGRSSMYGESVGEAVAMGTRSETSSIMAPSMTDVLPQEGDSETPEVDTHMTQRLHSLRLQLLEHFIRAVTQLQDVGGVRAIPLMQVILALTSDLAADQERDKAVLDLLLSTLISQLDIKRDDVEAMSGRSAQHEVQLVIMRLLSVLMSRSKAGTTKPSTESGSSFLSAATAAALLQVGGLDFCMQILKSLLEFWKKTPLAEQEGSVLPGQLLKPHPSTSPPDMSPFFLRQYVKGHANDVFEDYPQLITEVVLRLPYQMKKTAENIPNYTPPPFKAQWGEILAEYMMTQQAPFVRRQVRKLLLYICGSKEKYRELRDSYALRTHLSSVTQLCTRVTQSDDVITPNGFVLPYDVLITLVEHLKAINEVAMSRTTNWQNFCKTQPSILSFLVKAAIGLDEAISPILLQLLQCLLCGVKGVQNMPGAPSHHSSSSKHKKDKENKAEKEESEKEMQQHDEAMCTMFVQMFGKAVSPLLMLQFMRCFLLASNQTAVRWQAHALILHVYRCSAQHQQEALLEQLWSLWDELPEYGRKGSQFVDLLGFFSLKTLTSDAKVKQYAERAVSVLRGQNRTLAQHPNGSLYNLLQGLVEFDGYYLESDPCLVCNNPEVPYANLKLSSLKVDSKFTTSSQIVKLVGSHTISKIVLRITDLKRTKMVRTLSIHYNNRTVQAVVELKNKPGLWHKAKKVVLTAGQTEVKVEFPLPIVACNLMIEYTDFYDNLQGTAETLQCPRCSASVPANPGVCGNCGENVFQCHKCRAINYDEKDPFLCNACGFCKYAKFDFTLTAKPCCAVDPIENEEDRKKAVSSINTLLEKADRLYRQLQTNRPTLDALLVRISERAVHSQETVATGGPGGSNTVNKAISQVAMRYCGDCKNSFDELSKIIQKVIASRKELLEYERRQREIAQASALPQSAPPTPSIEPEVLQLPVAARTREVQGCDSRRKKEKLSHCYGCASATVEHCVTLVRALATNTALRNLLCNQGLIKELVEYNLKRGTALVRSRVRILLCLLTKDNVLATEQLNNLLMTRITSAINGHMANSDFAGTVRHEMMLLGNTVQREDKCWELRLRAVLKLLVLSIKVRSPAVLEFVTMPTLRIVYNLIQPDAPKSTKHKEKSALSLCTVNTTRPGLNVNVQRFLAADPSASYAAWKQSCRSKPAEWATKVSSKKKEGDKPKDKSLEKRITHVKYLMEKYGTRWLEKVHQDLPLVLEDMSWLRAVMFTQCSSSTRKMVCNMVETMWELPGRRKHIIDMLTGFLPDIGQSGEASTEYLALYKSLLAQDHWKFYLALQGVLSNIGELINIEIDKLTELEETTLTSDLSLGFALKSLTELMALFVQETAIKQHYKTRLVGVVLNGYLSLRRLIVQRTKLVDDTQEKLLELLEDMTTGTESESKEFMSVCVETVKRYPMKDQLSPVFIFERLCSIIYPEDNDVGEFFMSLEKDPQQEDFLQGRMLGNPYSSSEQGLGPLMRDVKNKICSDCELVALLEDDTGMELLVNNKIISLDLPVVDVYKKIWMADHVEGEPMRVVYRMRGLLGDATEDMVNSLDSGKDEGEDEEKVYKMAALLSENGGLQAMLQRLAGITDLVTGKHLLTVLLKLFDFCVKVKVNRVMLIQPEMNTISIMLGALNLALLAEQESGTSTKGQTLTEQILAIMETILTEASAHLSPSKYQEFSVLCGDKVQVMLLLDRVNSPFVRANPNVLQNLMRLIPFLAFGDHEKMQALVQHFKSYLKWEIYDAEHSEDEEVHVDCFCVIADGIETNANGDVLKDIIFNEGVVGDAIAYIKKHAPEIKTFLATDSDLWKDFLSKPSLPYVLRLLAGLSKGYVQSQVAVGNELIPILHKLEQQSSQGSIGTLSENLMEALKDNESVSNKIGEVRKQTKEEKKRLAMAMRQKQLGALGMTDEKKRLAMAMRQKQLGALGMTTNEKGQVVAKGAVLQQMEEIKEETGLVCCICREGYRYQPAKVLGLYTYTKRTYVDEFENKPRKTAGFSTVTHFNVVHIDCHLAAVRLARAREEWVSAELQNANTKCNGLLPIWGPLVPESAFVSCLARHNTYLEECTGIRDATYAYTIHDLKHLFNRLAFEKSFSEDSGGGGRHSNMHAVPYFMNMALYVMNTTRSSTREEKNLDNFLKAPVEKWVENSYETEGAQFYCVLTAHILNKEGWNTKRVALFKRLLVTAQCRHVSPAGTKTLSDKAVKEYSVYKPYLLFWAVVDLLYNVLFKHKKPAAEENWSNALADYIRHYDVTLLQQSDKLVSTVEEELVPAESFAEFCDVAGLLEDIADPDAFLRDLLASVP